MNSIYYAQTTYWVLFVDLLMAMALLGLYKTGGASNRKLLLVSLILAGFIALLHWVFGGQNLLPPDLSGGLFYALILGGASAVVALFYVSSRNNFDALSQEHIQLVQGVRVFVGGGFLMEGVLDVIPGWFSIMDGFLHIASGFFALVAAIAFLKNHSGKSSLLWLANGIGLLDIIIIVTSICFVVWQDLGPFHNMHYVVFGAGPILLWLHLMSIRKLLATPKAEPNYAHLPG